jgi:uncharacterized membrane protein
MISDRLRHPPKRKRHSNGALHDRRGQVAIITALVLVVFVGLAALVVEVGLAYSRRTSLQAATDMAVLDGAWQLPVTTNSGFTGENASTATSVTSATTAGLAANGYSGAAVTGWPTVGRYTPNPATVPASRYVANASLTNTVGTNTCASMNAVQLESRTISPLYFGRSISNASALSPQVLATATRNVDAAFRVGSGLVSVGQTGVANAVLTSLLGSTVTLTAVDYQNLLNANVNALAFANALASQINLTAGTYSGLLQSEASVGNIIAAELAVLESQGSVASAAVTSLEKLQAQVSASGAVQLSVGQLLDFGTWDGQQIGSSTAPPAAVFGTLNAYDLITFAAQAANGSDALSINQTGISIPGVATLSVALSAIEPPKPSYYSFGTPCTVAHTAQVRLQLQLSVGISVLGLGLVTLNLPVYVEIANGTATLLNISCPTSAPGTTIATINAQSGVGLVEVGTVTPAAMNDFTSEPTVTATNLISLVGGLVSAAGSATVPIAAASSTMQFSFASPSSQTSTQTQEMSSTSALTTIGPSLLSGLSASLTVNLLGIPIVTIPSWLLSALGAILSPVGTALSPLDAILQSLLGALGIGVGNVTVFAGGARCGPPVLVQ